MKIIDWLEQGDWVIKYLVAKYLKDEPKVTLKDTWSCLIRRLDYGEGTCIQISGFAVPILFLN